MRAILCLCLLLSPACQLISQIRQFPYLEGFDSANVPALPQGWESTANRLASGDFMTTHSAPRSDSAAAISTNATVAQSLVSPLLDLSAWEADRLTYFERRSGTHTSGVVVEASTDGGSTFSVAVSDTLSNPGVASYVERTFPLPQNLGTLPGVRIRWRILGNGTGTTGTFRIDDVAISARARIDLRLAGLAAAPPFPLAGETVMLEAAVRNAGIEPVASFAVEFYRDQDGDSLPDPEERFAAVPFALPIAPGDSVTALAGMTAGAAEELCIALVVAAGDQDGRNDLRTLALLPGYRRGSVVVSEIMYAPASPEPEWVELASTLPDSLDLARWSISDRNPLARYEAGSGPIWLAPGGFIIVTKDSLRFGAAHPDARNVAAVEGMPTSLFNNDSDAVILFDRRGAVMDSVPYRAIRGGAGGVSLERIEPSGGSLDAGNWGACAESSGSTPGRRNFLTPLDTNVRAVRMALSGGSGESATIVLTVENIGRSVVALASASLFRDLDGDSVGSPGELVAAAVFDARLEPLDSVLVAIGWERPPPGRSFLIASVQSEGDMRRSDDWTSGSFALSYPSGALLLNEIMYEPAGGRAEYVECYNPSAAPVDVRGWALINRRGAVVPASEMIARAQLVIGPGEFLVIASDSSMTDDYPGFPAAGSHLVIRAKDLGLGNGGDSLLLLDESGRSIDSAGYAPSWHNPDLEDPRGRSLERLNTAVPGSDPSNWSTSADPLGGTPGRRNSLHTPTVRGAGALSFAPNPFSPDGDGHEDATLVSYRAGFRTGSVRAKIFDAQGRMVRLVWGGEPASAAGEFLWDGFTDGRERVPMGIYIVVVEAHDAEGGGTETLKGVVVVASRP